MNDCCATIPQENSRTPTYDQLNWGRFSDGPSPVDSLLSKLRRWIGVDAHGDRTAWLTHRISLAMGIDPSQRVALVAAAATHDVGKRYVSARICEKPASLSIAERTIMRSHTRRGSELLAGMRRRHAEGIDLRVQASVALLHHERWDGNGYPFGLKGTHIPLEARIVSVADVFDALTAVRSYKPAWPVGRAIQFIRDEREKQFDPACVDAFLSLSGALENNLTSFFN
jgi:putative two-component system response regulator